MQLSALSLDNSGNIVNFDWSDVAQSSSMVVFNGIVLNIQPYLSGNNSLLFGADVDAILYQNIGNDITAAMYRSDNAKSVSRCLTDAFGVGAIDKSTPGCFAADVFNVIVLIVIIGLVLSRFFMALIYTWFIAPKLTMKPEPQGQVEMSGVNSESSVVSQYSTLSNLDSAASRMEEGRFMPNISRFSTFTPPSKKISYKSSNFVNSTAPFISDTSMKAILLVTCYSEDKEGILATLSSLASTTVLDEDKLLFLIADGVVVGGGNTLSTPEICKSFIQEAKESEPMSYVAVAEGSRQHNRAKVVSKVGRIASLLS